MSKWKLHERGFTIEYRLFGILCFPKQSSENVQRTFLLCSNIEGMLNSHSLFKIPDKIHSNSCRLRQKHSQHLRNLCPQTKGQADKNNCQKSQFGSIHTENTLKNSVIQVTECLPQYLCTSKALILALHMIRL